ncbi:hypothetical protein JX266_007447 [Neoarthrinium moseri]|nr:hypothetical protein JX266_007447 [Neoarthrinium moseri]
MRTDDSNNSTVITGRLERRPHHFPNSRGVPTLSKTPRDRNASDAVNVTCHFYLQPAIVWAHPPRAATTPTMDPASANNPLLSPPELSPLEQEVLEEYERLAENMKKMATILDTMANQPTTEILDGLRELERKTSLVFTLLKASVYSIVLQQEIDWGSGEQGRH